jgi:uncharacterized RDD family membrane protein YckC
MECRYCQAANGEDEHRCRRCGRRLRMSPVYTGSSAAAPALQYEAAPVLQHEPAPVLQREAAPVLQSGAAPILQYEAAGRLEPHGAPGPRAPRRPVTYQPSLFTSRELPMVVRFETIAPGSLPPSPRKPQPSAPRQRRRKVIPGQQALEFTHQFAQSARSAKLSARSARPADGVIYCDAPVAIPAHRAMAAALDASIILMALAVFGIIFRLAGGTFLLNARTAPMFIGAAAGVVIFYRMLWCLANGDTAGQKWTRLRLVNFDGQTPTRAQRFYRTASGFLSLMAGGIGLLWGLVDEETLTWHDHISKTFPTPVN